MNEYIELGVINTLQINRVSEPGIYLICEDGEEVLLPNAYITNEMNVGDTLDVFVYTDSEDRLVSTTLKPYLYKNEFAALEVVDTAMFGAFVDIGLPKDLLVPKNKQKSSFEEGDTKVIQMVEDEKTDRLMGTEKFTLQTVSSKSDEYRRNDEVEVLVYMKSPLGFKVIVDNTYDGLMYHNEIFSEVHVGDYKRAYIRQIREDGKLDISLQRIGAKGSDANSQIVLDVLNTHNNEISFTYKSDAEDIRNVFGLSKKAYKASLTKLIDEKKIILTESSIKLNV